METVHLLQSEEPNPTYDAPKFIVNLEMGRNPERCLSTQSTTDEKNVTLKRSCVVAKFSWSSLVSCDHEGGSNIVFKSVVSDRSVEEVDRAVDDFYFANSRLLPPFRDAASSDWERRRNLQEELSDSGCVADVFYSPDDRKETRYESLFDHDSDPCERNGNGTKPLLGDTLINHLVVVTLVLISTIVLTSPFVVNFESGLIFIGFLAILSEYAQRTY